MSGFGYSLLGFLVAIAILVAVHEYGHFWVARKMGVKVLKFSIGFGRNLFSWRGKPDSHGDSTEYAVGMIPLGGYVKMLDGREGDVPAEQASVAFNNKSLLARSAVVFAGPAFNFIFAIFAIWLVLLIGSPDTKPIVGTVVEGSIAEKAGFREGDKLLSVDGRQIRGWSEQELYLKHQLLKDETVNFAVASEGDMERELTIDLASFPQDAIAGASVTSLVGLYSTPPRAVVGSVMAATPAAEAGLVEGDLITAVNGNPVADWVEMSQLVRANPAKKISLTIQRDGIELVQPIVPERIEVEGQDYGRLGIGPVFPDQENQVFLRQGPLAAIGASAEYNWRMTILSVQSIGQMITGQISPKHISGPITIARVAGNTIESGLINFLQFLALISMSLGIINLLPIPVLDGGHLLYFAYEAVMGKEPSESAMLIGQQIGIVLLVMLMGLAFYNDIMRLLGLL